MFRWIRKLLARRRDRRIAAKVRRPALIVDRAMQRSAAAASVEDWKRGERSPHEDNRS